jgi:predicted nucleic acid-binding protein
MIYVDTSVLVAYYCPEPLSEKVETFLTAHTKPIISALTEIELFSTVSKKVRTKEMKRKDAGRVIARFLADIENDYYTYLSLEASHYRLARDWIGMFILPLRTLDALHLAISSSEGVLSFEWKTGL